MNSQVLLMLFITTHSERRKVLFLAPSVCGFFCLHRVSTKSPGMISSRFPEVSRRHFDQKLSTLCSFFEAVSKLNEEALGPIRHLSPDQQVS